MSEQFRDGRDGRDSKKVKILFGYMSSEGDDGHVVPVPPGGTSRQGRDGRVVALGWVATPAKVGTEVLLCVPMARYPVKGGMVETLRFHTTTVPQSDQTDVFVAKK